MDPRVQELIFQQQKEFTVLFDQFRADHPNLQIDVEGVDWWSEEDEAEFAALTAALDAEHAAQREALAVIIDNES